MSTATATATAEALTDENRALRYQNANLRGMLSDLHDHLDRELAVTAAVRLAVGHVSTKLDGPPPLRQALPAARPDSLKATIGLEHNPEEQE